MRITFFGLSCFLMENQAGFRILVDPFNDEEKWSLGPVFPKEFRGRPFGANIVLMSEPDADHAYAPGGWLQHAPPTETGSDPFPGLDVRGTVIHEFNGDLNIAWHYTVDGLRLLHLADNAHVLTASQLHEMGRPDVVFMSAPKVEGEDAIDRVVRKNLARLRPKLVVWAHHVAPADAPASADAAAIDGFFRDYFRRNVPHRDAEGLMPLAVVYRNAALLTEEYGGAVLRTPEIEVDAALLARGSAKPYPVFFASMAARSAADGAGRV